MLQSESISTAHMVTKKELVQYMGGLAIEADHGLFLWEQFRKQKSVVNLVREKSSKLMPWGHPLIFLASNVIRNFAI